jgi:YihY family inner membrane protein
MGGRSTQRTRGVRSAARRAAGAANGGSRSARSFADRAVARLPGPLGRIVQRAREDDILLVSAGLGFYALVSIPPIVIVALWLAGLVAGDDSVDRLADQIGRVAPKDLGIDRAVRQISEQGTSLGLSAMAIGLWPATAYGAGLVRAFERLAEGRKSRRRTPLFGRLLMLTIVLPLFVLGSILASFAGASALGDALVGRLLGLVLALVAGFIGASVAVALIYRIFPPERLTWRQIVRGTVVAAVGIAVLSLGLVLYVNLGANFADHYVSSGLAAVVLTAVWLFLSNALLLVGFKAAQE